MFKLGCVYAKKEGSQSYLGQPHDLITTYLNLQIKKGWIISILNGEKTKAFWEFRENPDKKWWQRTDSAFSSSSFLKKEVNFIKLCILILCLF